MSTISWLELLIFLTVTVGTLMYYFGRGIGIEQQKINVEARRASMRRHPSNHIRVIK